MGKHPDVTIIGGGVIGLTTAYFLAREGVSVHMIDRLAMGTEASWAGAGIIPPGNLSRAVTLYDQLRASSSEEFPSFSSELLERTGIDNGYRICGGIEVFGKDADEATRLWEEERILFEPLSLADPSGSGRARSVCAGARLEPHLHLPPGAAYLLPGMAQVRNPWHLRALVSACESLGIKMTPNTPIVRMRTSGNRIEAAADESGIEYLADKYLFASGAWTDRLLAPLGIRTGVHPVRGQIVLFRPAQPLLRRIVNIDKQYLVPREDGRILAGSTEEPEAGFEKQTTEEGINGLIRFATELVPALASAPIEKTWAGLRPGSIDGLPDLGRLPGFENAFVAAGHFRAGIQLSPATARVMCELITGREPSISLNDFCTNRLPSPMKAVAFRS
ncbi:MAG: FAD-dependent oxidoreductase [Gemmataceae bacterium]|nr:FAD-dependent oxidoreductase [Gemmataceae bacterium]